MARGGNRARPGSTPALVALAEARIRHTVHGYEHDGSNGLSYGLEAATLLGVEPSRVFKTLVASVDTSLVIAVIPVDLRLDLKALAQAVGGRSAVMADKAVAMRSTGYVVGGISPIGQRQRLRTVVDRTSLDHATIYVSAGRRGLDVELAPADLISATSATTGAIARTEKVDRNAGGGDPDVRSVDAES